VAKKSDTTAITSGRSEFSSLSGPTWGSTVWESESLEDARRRATTLRSKDFYGRYANPTVTQFEEAIAALEGAESALACASGMGAIATTVLALCSQGSHIVAQNNMYGATLSFLQGPCARLGIETTFVDATVPGAFARAVIPGRTTIVLAETPSNPLLTITDLEEIGKISGPFTVVDSTLATPLGQRPLEFGVDIVLHSATKGIGGHNDALLGVIAGEKDLVDAIWSYSIMHGAIPSAHDALNALRGIRTLPIRVARQHSSLLEIAHALENHHHVSKVHHPFLQSHPQHVLAAQQMNFGGTVLSFEIDGGFDDCVRFVDALHLPHVATSFGGPETLICHPATSTHVGIHPDDLQKSGITQGLLRMSVGLEDPADIISDLLSALDTALS
jgi:cystathionine beta-lyase/cystathionine gamma-synthase